MSQGKFRLLGTALLVSGFTFGIHVFGQQVDVSTAATSSTSFEDVTPSAERDIYNPKGFWPLLGAGLGYMGKTDTIRSGGVPAHVRFIGSYYAEGPWVGEVGGGLYNEILSQKGGDADTIQELELEAATRYQLPQRWSIGPVWTTLTGNNRYRSNTKNWTSFLGLQVKRDIAWDNKHLVRLGGRFMTDVGVSGEQINAAMFEVEVGLGSGSSPGFVQVEPPVVEPAPIAPHLADRAMSGPIIFDGPLNFIENQPVLISTASRRADRLARVLADNSQLFDRIEVIGHADERGPSPFNQKLSERRAEFVAHRFRRAGLSETKLSVEGKGAKEPLAFNHTETSWFKNRRVEVRILGVKDQAALESLLRSVN
jgi:outer membrane protein OmpA-like peptidoglycan-associated protein